MPDHYEIHPITDLFPGMLPEEFELFKEDVRANGLREPIVLFEKRIIDGRHRQRACDETGTPARYRGWSGSPHELLAYVVSTNLRRRHLTEQQRALIAAKLSKYGHGGERRADQEANLPLDRLTRAAASKLMDVSHRTVTDAAKVIDQGAPELVEAVRSGKVAVSTAAALADQPPAVQQEIVARGEKEIVAKAKAIKEARSAVRQEKRRNELLVTANAFELETTPDDIAIHHGDARDTLQAIAAESVDLVVTSPPYPGVPKMWGPLFTPENFDAAHVWLDAIWDECVRVLKPGCKLCINIGNIGRRPYLNNSARVALWGMHCKAVEPIGEIIWHKHVGSRKTDTAWGTWSNPADPALVDNHEHILIFRKHGNRAAPTAKPIIDPDKFLDWRKTLWEFSAANASNVGHIAPFPPELPMRLITMYTFPGETVLDPFLGSGTTLVEALKLKRKGIGVEKDEGNVRLSKLNVHGATSQSDEVT